MNIHASLLFSLVFLMLPTAANAASFHTSHLVLGVGVLVVLTFAAYIIRESWRFYKSHHAKPVLKKRNLARQDV